MCEAHCHYEDSLGRCKECSPPLDGLCMMESTVRCEDCSWAGERDEVHTWIEFTSTDGCGRGRKEIVNECPHCGSKELEGL